MLGDVIQARVYNEVPATSIPAATTESGQSDGGFDYEEHAISDTDGDLSVGIYRPKSVNGQGDAFIIDDKTFSDLQQHKGAFNELSQLCERTNSSIIVIKHLAQDADSSDSDKIVSSLSSDGLFDQNHIHNLKNPSGEISSVFRSIDIAMNLKKLTDNELIEKYRSCFRGFENVFVTMIVLDGQLNTITKGELPKLIAKELAQESAKTVVGGVAWAASTAIAGAVLPAAVAGPGSLLLGKALFKCSNQLLSSAIDRILLAYRCPFPNWANPYRSDIKASLDNANTPRFLPFLANINMNHDIAGRLRKDEPQLNINTLWVGRKSAPDPLPEGTLIISEAPPELTKVKPRNKESSRSKMNAFTSTMGLHRSQKDAVQGSQGGLASQTLKVAIDYIKTPVMAAEIFLNRAYDWVKASKGISLEKAEKLKNVIEFAVENHQGNVQEFDLICDEMATRNINTDNIRQDIPDSITTYLSFYTDTKITKDTVEWKAGKVSATLGDLTRLVDSIARGDNPAKTIAKQKKYSAEQFVEKLSKADTQAKEDRVKLYSAIVTGSLKDDLSAQVKTMVNSLKYAHKLHAEFDSGKVDKDYSRFINKEGLQRQVEMLPKLAGMLEELDLEIEAFLPALSLSAARESFRKSEDLSKINQKTPKAITLNEANLERIHNMLEKCMAACLYANEIHLEPTLNRGEDVLPSGKDEVSATHALSEEAFAGLLLPLEKAVKSISASASSLAALGFVA
ncbi:hypothetical protein [Pantoea sp. App145]|uniref:hypothetical protein n=1 Tax=Pantoea sp. App145 TaxID=3071567 RepID=UPI003A7FC906